MGKVKPSSEYAWYFVGSMSRVFLSNMRVPFSDATWAVFVSTFSTAPLSVLAPKIKRSDVNDIHPKGSVD